MSASLQPFGPTLLPQPLELSKLSAKMLAFGYRCHSLWSFSPGASPLASLRGASVGLGLDFARYLCHSIGQHHLAAGPCPAHNLPICSRRKRREQIVRAEIPLRGTPPPLLKENGELIGNPL